MHDPQLAITVARVYEGSDTGPVLRTLLETKILPSAIASGNRWLASWTFWMLKRKDMAVRSILSPLTLLLPPTTSLQPHRDPTSRLFLLNDPALIIFYKHIRERSVTTLRGAMDINPSMERDFVMATTRVYDRMGCDLLALDLVKNWEFLRMPEEALMGGPRKKSGGMMSMREKRRNSAAAGEFAAAVPQGERKKWQEGLVKPPAAVWEEPDMSWAF